MGDLNLECLDTGMKEFCELYCLNLIKDPTCYKNPVRFFFWWVNQHTPSKVEAGYKNNFNVNFSLKSNLPPFFIMAD